MWTIIKYDKKNLNLLLQDLKKKMGNDFVIYRPKMRLKKFNKNKVILKPIDLLGDYIFCFHRNFENKNFIQKLKFCRGLKYFLNGHVEFQSQIISFIEQCKCSEDSKGFISQSFYEIDLFRDYKFLSGPFSEKIFKVIGLEKNRINVLMGNLKTKVDKKDFLFSPI